MTTEPDRIAALINQHNAAEYHRRATSDRKYSLYSASSDNPTARRYFQGRAAEYARRARMALGIEEPEQRAGLIQFMYLAHGTKFRMIGGTSVYRRLFDGTAFECLLETSDRVTEFKAFDVVEVVR